MCVKRACCAVSYGRNRLKIECVMHSIAVSFLHLERLPCQFARAYHWIKHSLNCQHLRCVCVCEWMCVYAYCLHTCANSRQIRRVGAIVILLRCSLTPRYFLYFFKDHDNYDDVAKSNSKPKHEVKKNNRTMTDALSQWWWCCCWWRLSLAKFSLAQNNSCHCHLLYEEAK